MISRGLTSVVGILLLVVITVVMAAAIGSFFVDIPATLTDPAEQRVYGDTEVVLGSEHRSWSGWNDSGGETRGDIDKVIVPYLSGEDFKGSETGAIEVNWDGGSVRFLNPERFDAQTDQKYHDDDVGDFCTGGFHAGETLTIRIVHNKWQEGGETDPDNTIGDTDEKFGVRYVESSWNDISRSAGKPFFRTEDRYPIEYDGSGIIEPGDEITVTFYGPDGKLVVAETTGTARLAEEDPREFEVPDC